MASFTNYDDDDDGGANDDVDVAGPGVDVLSYTGDDGTIQAWSGTSMAAPAVAGLLLMTPQDGEGPTKTVNGAQVSDAADGIQDGEDVFPNYTTFTDPYALSTLYGGIEPYKDGFNDDDQPDDAPEGDDDWEEGDDTDENDYNNDSPWNGYDPDNYYFETVGNIKGQLGTYSMSTGPSSVQQATLEEDLGITAGDLDKAMTSYVDGSSSFFTGYTNSTTKNGINATEGSGIKFTGYAQAGDTLVFDYLIASNDYIPYNDFAFVQLKTGDALGNWDGQAELQSLGSIGLDIDNFGSKKGTFSYTLTAEDFNNSNYSSTTAPTDANISGGLDLGDYTLDVNGDGINDVKDEIVLNIDGAQTISSADYILDVNGDGQISSADLSNGALTFGGDSSNSIAILKGSASEDYVLNYIVENLNSAYTASYNYATYSVDFAAYLDKAFTDFALAFEGAEQFDDDGDPVYQGFFDLSVGVTDAIDGWVDTTLMVKGMGLVPEGQDENLIDDEQEGIWEEDTLTWSGDNKLGNGTVSNNVATMSTGSGAVGQSVLEAIIGLEEGVLDTNLNGTKYAIDATSGSGVYATTYAQIGDVVSFDYSFDTNDYSPYKDFSWFSVNDTVEKIVALGEDVENFGKAKGTITYMLEAEDFDDYIEPFTDENGQNAGGGKLTLAFGVMDALDTCVDSYLSISNVSIYDPENADEIPDDKKEATADEIITDWDQFESNVYGNVSPTFTGDDLTQVILSTQYNYGGTAYTGDPEANISTANTLSAADIEWYTGLESGILSTSLNGTKDSINATTGSAISLSGVGAVGDTFNFDFAFASNDYNPYEDFAYVSVNEEAYVLQDLNTTSSTYGQSAVVTNLSNNIGASDYTGYFEYTLTKADLGGSNFGDFTLSAGVMNALDNAVSTTLTLSNFDYTPGELLEEVDGEYQDELQDVYEDDISAYFETIGDVYVETDAYGGFSLSTAGNVASDSVLESFAQLANKTLDKSMSISDGWTDTSFNGSSSKAGINATEGSAVQFVAQAAAGDSAYFYYYFDTNDYTPYADYSWYSVGDTAYMIAGVGTNVDNWGSKEGFIEYEITADDLNEQGEFVLTVGVVDALDSAVESVIDIWGFGIAGTGEETPDYEAPQGIDEGDGYEEEYWDDYDPNEDSYYSDLIPDEDDDVYEEIDIEMLGNTFQTGDSVVMSTGGGAIDQYDIENALGLKDGALDEAFATYDSSGNVIEVTKEAIDATQGSAAYDTVEVKVGDVINFGFTFGTDDYIPYQDFAFFALNGQAHNLATVGVEVDSYGQYSDVYNYVISADDLGGEDSGVVTIGVGIMDAIDYCVDSYIEVYDFEISGDEKYDDATNDGIVDGESAYSINTAVGQSSYDAATSNTVKLSFKGQSVSAETSDLYDVVASAASTVVSGGYQVLLEGTGTKDGKWFVHQTDAYGGIINNKKSGWKTEAKAINLGWEQIFNFDINGDSILEGTSENDTLQLYSAQTGGITISNYITTYNPVTEELTTDTSTVKQGDVDILSATASKADFTTFSTPGETLQMLIAGSGNNAGKFQVWTTLENGTVIDKKGYTDWTQDDQGEWSKKENDWYTSEQAIAVGLEDDFAYDIDSNGILSGGSSYKILGPNGGLVVKNAKGIALDDVTAPYYSPIGAVKTKTGYDLALKGATGSNYEGLFSIWKTNEFGKVLSEAEWITEDQFIAGKYEKYFNADANSDGLIGVSALLDESDTSDTKVAVGDKNTTVVQTEDQSNSGVVVSTVLTNEKGKQLKIKMGAFTMLDAETISGVNQAVYTAKNGKSIQIFNYSDDWSTYQSKSKIKAKTDAFYQAEINFNADLNNDGIIATKVGNEYVAKALVASEDGLTDMYKNDANQILFTYNEGEEYTFQDNKGKSVKAKQGKYEVTDVLGTDDAEMKVAFSSGKALKIYTLADPNYVEGTPLDPEAITIQGIETIKGKKATFFEQEIAFNYDFNEDGIVGNLAKAAASVAVGDFTAQYDYLGKAFYETDVDGVATSFELQNKKGKQLKATFGKNELSGVGEIDGVFTAIYKNSKNNLLSIYEMTAAAGNKQQVGKTIKVKTKEITAYLGYESDFGIDFNGDGFVGKDIAGATDANGNVIGDGTFDDDDLILGENKGQVEQYTDLAGALYAKGANDSDASALTVDNGAFVDGAYKKLKGWSVLGLDTTFTEDGSVNNIGIFNKGKKYQMISFGSDWNFDTSNDTITSYKAKDLVSNNIEDLFVQDLNNDSFI